MAKTVAVIGAGPAGLVAAKTLLHHAIPGTAFSVTLFEAQPRIGGLWPRAKDDTGGLVHPLMIANQSKHTVQFSDLAWEKDAPDFPRVWQVGKYLERYLERYCMPFAGDRGLFRLRLGEKVVKVKMLDGPSWELQTRSLEGKEATDRFDYVLVASGFFGKPVVPEGIIKTSTVPVIHSSRYRDLLGLLGLSQPKGKKILVVGGQMSGIEIAGTIGSQLVSAVNSVEPSPIPYVERYTVHHVIQRPVWVKALYISPDPSKTAPVFLPVDLPSYNTIKRPSPFTDSQGHITVEAAQAAHGIHHAGHGSDQSEIHRLLGVSGGELDEPPYLAMSDTYMELVRSGTIEISRGKLESLEGNTATLSPSGERISDVAAVILATGFEAAESLSFLPDEILATLQPDPTDLNNTFALAFHNTHHPDIPHLGFCGFYRSPYWGVAEMQARFLTAKWAAEPGTLPAAMKEALDKDNSIQRTLSLRGDPRASQFPMGDYPYLMQEFANALGIEISPPSGGNGKPESGNIQPADILTPARYQSPGATPEQVAEIIENLQQTQEAWVAGTSRGKWLARAVFRSLAGEWKLERDLRSRLPSHPSGHFSGGARFLLRDGTADGLDRAEGADADLSLELLYIEDGTFTADNGLSFRAMRRYVWRYDERRDVLSVWFVRTDHQRRADYLFHEIEFEVPPPSPPASSPAPTTTEEGGDGWRAKAGHLCVEDFYDVNYRFRFNAVNLAEWTCGYTVKGPKKDYTIHGTYTRHPVASDSITLEQPPLSRGL